MAKSRAVTGKPGRAAKPRRQNDVTQCRRNGWKVGTRLVGDEGYGPTIIELTAIGRDRILAVQISHNGKPSVNDWEADWTLSERRWRKVRR
jgi:hypothetical protein